MGASILCAVGTGACDSIKWRWAIATEVALAAASATSLILPNDVLHNNNNNCFLCPPQFYPVVLFILNLLLLLLIRSHKVLSVSLSKLRKTTSLVIVALQPLGGRTQSATPSQDYASRITPSDFDGGSCRCCCARCNYMIASSVFLYMFGPDDHLASLPADFFSRDGCQIWIVRQPTNIIPKWRQQVASPILANTLWLAQIDESSTMKYPSLFMCKLWHPNRRRQRHSCHP